MPQIDNTQWGRKVSLLLVEGETALDLSDLHFRFQTAQQDEESPSNCSIRVFNLSPDTLKWVKGEYSRVVLQAGYEGGAFGVIFDGTIKQFRIGKDNDARSTYLDILAADGDIAYNFSRVNQSMAAGTTSGERLAVVVAEMTKNKVKQGEFLVPSTGGILPRGKVLFGMAKAIMRAETQNLGATWTINDGKVNVIPLTGYLPGEAVELSAITGLIGRPEQTAEGIKCRCLLNPKITVGGTVRINNTSINQTIQQQPGAAPLAYDKWASLQTLAEVTTDGLYRVYVAEYVGDTRGNEFYTDLTCLTINPVTNMCKAYG